MMHSLFSYQPSSGFLFRVHPMVKGLVAVSSVLTITLHSGGAEVSFALCICMLLAATKGGMRVGEALAGLKSLALLFFVLAAFHLVQENGGINRALDSCFRLTGVFLTSAFFVMSSSQSELMFFWEGCFMPFELFGIPTRELALVMVIAVRFLPVFFSEIERIRMAQTARGADFVSKGLMGAARQFLPLLIPVLELSIRRAEELAVAMEARGYCLHSPRTRFRVYHLGCTDVLIGTAALVVALLVLLLPAFAAIAR